MSRHFIKYNPPFSWRLTESTPKNLGFQSCAEIPSSLLQKPGNSFLADLYEPREPENDFVDNHLKSVSAICNTSCFTAFCENNRPVKNWVYLNMLSRKNKELVSYIRFIK